MIAMPIVATDAIVDFHEPFEGRVCFRLRTILFLERIFFVIWRAERNEVKRYASCAVNVKLHEPQEFALDPYARRCKFVA